MNVKIPYLMFSLETAFYNKTTYIYHYKLLSDKTIKIMHHAFAPSPPFAMTSLFWTLIFLHNSNVFGIANDILITEFDDLVRDYEETVDKVLRICRKSGLKLNKEKCHFRCTSIPLFGEVISHDGWNPDHRKLKALIDMLPLKHKEKLQSFLGMINYLSKFSPANIEVCELLRKFMSVKSEWLWNKIYQDLYNKAKR